MQLEKSTSSKLEWWPRDSARSKASTTTKIFRFESIRSLIAMGVVEDWNFDQMDVSTAFLYADLEEVTYVEVPDGISGVEGMVWRLLKYMYGLKQSPRIRNRTIDKVLEGIGFVRLQSDHAVYAFG